MRAANLLIVRLLGGLVVVLVCASPALAFVLDPVLVNGTPADPSDDLLDAARWSHVAGSLARDRVRGLGGGLEFAVADGVCDRLRLLDRPRPTCPQIRLAVRRAFSVWEAGHLRFTDATGRLRPALPPPGHARPWDGFGAEIDVFALSPGDYPRVRGAGAWTSFWFRFADPVATTGAVVSGNTITSADIVFNTAACYHLDPGLAGRGCNHFPSLLIHEIGHALGLGHPNEHRGRNFDTDRDPTNAMRIDCRDPRRGLRLSPRIDPAAVMNSSGGRPEPVHRGLAHDDRGAQDFLYPGCRAGGPAPQPGASWAAIAAAGSLGIAAGRVRRR